MSDITPASNGAPVVYTDGACSNNGHEGCKAGYGVWWGDNHPLNISKRLPGIQTNQRAEIKAVSVAIKQARDEGHRSLVVRTDSMFVINCLTKWVHSWVAKGWRKSDGKPVIHQTQLQEILDDMKDIDVNFEHIKAHRGDYGNENADRLATRGALLPPAFETAKAATSFSSITKSMREKMNRNSIVHTVGVCVSQGFKGGRAAYGIWWGVRNRLNLSCRLSGTQTLQRAELMAAHTAIKQAVDNNIPSITVKTSSLFVFNSLTKWVHKWFNLNWKRDDGTPVTHKKELNEIVEMMRGVQVEFQHITANHPDIHENDLARQLATDGTLKDLPKNPATAVQDILNSGSVEDITKLPELKRKASSMDDLGTSATKRCPSEQNFMTIPPRNIVDSGERVTVYAHGAYSHTKTKGDQAGYGVWWGEDSPLNTSCALEGVKTNQRAEVEAVNVAVRQAAENGYSSILVVSDSMYVINSLTKWLHGWLANGWRTGSKKSVAHKDEFMAIHQNMKRVKVEFDHVRNHPGVFGNKMAEEMADRTIRLK